MEQENYTPEPEPSSVEIALEKVSNYRSVVTELEADQNLTEDQKEAIMASEVAEYFATIETLPEPIQLFAMYALAAEDEWPDNSMEYAA